MIKIVFIGIAAVFLILLLKNAKPEFALLLSLCTCVVMMLGCVGVLAGVIDRLQELFSYAKLPGGYFSLLLKILGITYLADFGSALCKDAGQTAIAAQIDLAGRLVVISISLPVILAVFEELVRMI